jgi:hypothetical protein
MTYERASASVEAERGEVRLPPRPNSELGAVTVRAPQADSNLVQQTVDASGGVTLQTGSGVEAETERASFDGIRMTARGDAPVRVHGPAYVLHAQGFEFDSAEEAFDFGGPVRSGLGRPRP